MPHRVNVVAYAIGGSLRYFWFPSTRRSLPPYDLTRRVGHNNYKEAHPVHERGHRWAYCIRIGLSNRNCTKAL